MYGGLQVADFADKDVTIFVGPNFVLQFAGYFASEHGAGWDIELVNWWVSEFCLVLSRKSGVWSLEFGNDEIDSRLMTPDY
jgi:hypothetical protein